MIAVPVPESRPMNRFGVGLSCAAVLGLVACASEEIDQIPNLGNTAGRAGSGAANGNAAGRGGSTASNGAGSAGRASQSGGASSVAGASSNGTGGVGIAGASGSASSNGGTGTSGTTGNAGSGGASPIFESGTCASSPRMSLSYRQASNNSKQITALYQFSNTTDTPIPLAQLKIRYLFSDEETSGWSTAIYDAKLDGGTGGYRAIAGSALAVSPLGEKLPGADSYIELSFNSTLSIEKGATATVSWDLQPHSYSAPDQVQTDDYSYNAAAVAYTVWDHVLIYQGSSLVWGCTPKTANTGSGGASGAGSGGALNGGSSGALNGGASGASAGTGGVGAGTGGVGAGGAGAGGASGSSAGGVSSGGASGAAAAGGPALGGASGIGGEGGALSGGAGAGGSGSGGISGAP